MAGRRLRMPRRLSTAQPERTTNDGGAHEGDIVTFPTRDGDQQRKFDLGKLGLPSDIRDVFRHAITHHPSPLAHDTQEQYWYCIETFAQFAGETGIRTAQDLTTLMVNRYITWLKDQRNKRNGRPWTSITQGKRLITLRELIRTVKTNRPELLPAEILFPRIAYPGGTPPTNQRQHLTGPQFTSLIWACQQEIRENTRRLEEGREIMSGKRPEPLKGLKDALLVTEDLAHNSFPSTRNIAKADVSYSLLRQVGYAEGLRSYVTATPRTLAPLIVSIMAQLGGNVDAIRNLTVDCMSVDKIDEKFALIEWDKPRAGPAPNGTQRKWRDRTKRYGAPSLITLALKMTESLRPLTNGDDSNRIFICTAVSGHSPGTRVIAYAMLQRAARSFLEDARARISEWNKEHPEQMREQIPEFDLREIRSSVGLEHYLASGGDIRSAQQALNHRNVSTTIGYVAGPVARDRNVQILAEIQRQLIEDALSTNAAERQSQPDDADTTEHTAAPAFSHGCRAPAHARGALCSHFQQCLDCPGLVIPKTARHLAKLLKAKEAFEDAKARLHPKRWDWLYARSYTTLTQRILPQFPDDMRDEALELMSTLPPLPDLE